jgi:Kef-type K+ transport system membrane component KefB
MPVTVFFIIIGCLIFSSFMKWLLQPLFTVPAVFLHLLIGITCSLLVKLNVAPVVSTVLFNPATQQALGLLGWLGILLMMALGTSVVEEKRSKFDHSWRKVVAVSMAGFGGTLLVATCVGYIISLYQPGLMGQLAQPLAFSIAIGLACAVTALPVLVALLHERNEHGSAIGKLAVRVAVLDDLWLWLVLIVLLGLIKTQVDPTLHIAKVCGFVACALCILKPALASLYKRFANLNETNQLVFGLTLIVVVATMSEFIGAHALFGAFIAGWVMPAPVLKLLQSSLLPVSHALLVPFFFITTGMQTDLAFAHTDFLFLAAGFTVMGLGLKMLFVSLAARATGASWLASCELGALLQCKGLVEIVVLGLMRDAKIIGPEVFSALIMMALLCTVLTIPLRSLVKMMVLNMGQRSVAFSIKLHK